ncbi:MAG: hypothetical protein VYE36_07710, partial [Chloroflexota bacterium]|nr:hypothetical protein [Chloroflexota bacterium]
LKSWVLAISIFVLTLSAIVSAAFLLATARSSAPIWLALNMTTTAVRSTEIMSSAEILVPISN